MSRIFELRTYFAHPGKMPELHERFRSHTTRLFRKHGMELIGFWSPVDPTDSADRMLYVLAYPSREFAEAAWRAFREDPEWVAARTESERNGPLVRKIESTFLSPTDYSPIG